MIDRLQQLGLANPVMDVFVPYVIVDFALQTALTQQRTLPHQSHGTRHSEIEGDSIAVLIPGPAK